jgi:hypothetical protein
MKKERGSTRADALAAIIAVTMIITTAMAAVVPAMNKARAAAMRATCAEQMKQVAAGLSAYADEYNDMLPWYGGVDPNYEGIHHRPVADDTERHIYVAFRGDKAEYLEGGVYTGKPIPMRLACLYASGVVTNARIFYCPANVEASYRYESYINPLLPNTSYEWGTLPQQINRLTENQWVRTGYIYYPIDNHIPKDGLGAPAWTARRFSSMEANMPFMTDRIWNTTKYTGMDDLSHKEENIYAFNAVFKDGHVVFVKGKKTNGDNGIFDERLWRYYADGVWDIRGVGDSYRYFYYTIFKQVQP